MNVLFNDEPPVTLHYNLDMIFRSPYPQVTVPPSAITPFVLQKSRRLHRKPALIEALTGRTLTYGALAEGIRRVAAGLNRLGFKRSDVIALCSPNSCDYAIVFHAAVSLGGICTTLNPTFTVEELVRQLKDSGACCLFTVPELIDKALQAANEAGIRMLLTPEPCRDAVSLQSFLDSADAPPEVPIDPRVDLAALPYSSGTTGFPKGVMLTHYNLVANLLQIEAAGHAGENDILICVLPFFHIYGMQVILNLGLYQGATIVILPRFELATYLRVMQEYHVTFAHVVPPMVLALSKNSPVNDFDLSSLQRMFCAAAPLSEAITLACEERLHCRIRQGYGMTEASPSTHQAPWNPDRNRYGTAGFPISNTECRIVDPSTHRDCAAEEEGEIWIRGPQIMRGYLGHPGATAAVLQDGWYRSGDIGIADTEGRFRIVDRLKEMIKYKGFAIAPAELEAALLTHPAVADAAVISCADEEAGEIPKAYVVLKTPATSDELMDHVAEHVAPYKKVRAIEFVGLIPRSPSGKILRRVLVEHEKRIQEEKRLSSGAN